MIQDYLEPDAMWSAIEGAFSPEEAIYFRNYPIRVDNTVREVDYFVLHRTGILLLVISDFMGDDDNVRLMDGGSVRFTDALTNEPRTWHPLALAEQFISVFRNLDVPIREYRIVIWLPNISIDIPKPQQSANLPFQFIIGTQDDFIRSVLRRMVTSSDAERFDSQTWRDIVSRLNPPSPIQTRLADLNQGEFLEYVHNLSNAYITTSHKQTPIFISYRRDDAGWAAGRFYGDLKRIFAGEIFFDYDSIKPGALWKDAINQALDECIVQLVIIGKQWVNIKHTPQSLTPRIMEKDDMVRHEIQMAFRKKVTIIPILIDHQDMPKINELPYDLKHLPSRNSMLFNQDNYFAKFNMLVHRIAGLLKLATTP